MGISNIRIENFRSIKRLFIDFNKINIFIGENGAGKSNIISAINYYYKNLIANYEDDSIFDINNKFSNCVKISITFDLSKIIKICKNHINLGNSRYIKYYQEIINFADTRKKTVTLIKIKNIKVIWQGASFRERQILYELFPVYMIDSRKVDLEDWGNLWGYMGDLIKIDNDTSETIHKKFEEDISKYNLDTIFDRVHSKFKNLNIRLKKLSPKDYAVLMSQVYFSGKDFMLNDNRLSYNSNGINVFNYTNILIEILNIMAERKLKEPIIIMDEPELSLHNNFMDKMIDRIFYVSNNIYFLIATHSPRIVKYIMKYDEGYASIFHIDKSGKYSETSKMNMFEKTENKSRARVNDDHVNAYFSKLILAVEGETELELFNNKYLREVFPVLKDVHVIYKAMTDDPIKHIISPHYRKHIIPVIYVCDMDKFIDMDISTNTATIKNEFQNEFAKERYFYGRKRYTDSLCSRRILRIAEKCKFHYRYPFYETHDSNYKEFINLIKAHLKNYNYMVFSTTVEGALINSKNIDDIMRFIEKVLGEPISESGQNTLSRSTRIKNIYDSLNEYDKVNFIRLLFNGKSDYLFTANQIIKRNLNIDEDLKEIITSRIEKTSGWVSDWIEYCCLNWIGHSFEEHSFVKFAKAINESDNQKKIKKMFRLTFSELYDIIKMIEKLYN